MTFSRRILPIESLEHTHTSSQNQFCIFFLMLLFNQKPDRRVGTTTLSDALCLSNKSTISDLTWKLSTNLQGQQQIFFFSFPFSSQHQGWCFNCFSISNSIPKSGGKIKLKDSMASMKILFQSHYSIVIKSIINVLHHVNVCYARTSQNGDVFDRSPVRHLLSLKNDCLSVMPK